MTALTRSCPPDHQFPNTRWSVVLRAQGSDSELRHRALEQICRTYWLPVYAFARGQGLDPADAEERALFPRRKGRKPVPRGLPISTPRSAPDSLPG